MDNTTAVLLNDLAMIRFVPDPDYNGSAGDITFHAWDITDVVIISANEDPLVIQRALDHGAAGFIPKSSNIKTITNAINDILMGEIWAPVSKQQNLPGKNVSELALAERMAKLTPQQFKVLMMVSQGLLNKQIAYDLGISEATVKAHVTAVMNKLGVSNRTQAVLAAAKLNVLDPT